MGTIRKVEVFSAGCSVCEDAVKLVQDLACDSCEIQVLDMNESAVVSRARELGVKTVPAVAVDDRLVSCCRSAGISADALREADVGRPD